MEKVVFSVVETALRIVLIPQTHSNIVMNKFPIFSILLTSY